MDTYRALPLQGAADARREPKAQLIELDERWSEIEVLAGDRQERLALDRRLPARLGRPAARRAGRDRAHGARPARVRPHPRAHVRDQRRSSRCGACVLGYPLAYWLSTLPARQANVLMILVLVPFWTSILVRVAAWIVLLQSAGPGQPGADRARPDRAAARAAVQPHRRDHRHGAHPAAVHDPAAVQRDEERAADLPARGGVARQRAAGGVLSRLRAADLSRASAPARCWCSSWRSATTSRRRCSAAPTTRCSATTSRSTPT